MAAGERFRKIAHGAAEIAGRPQAFLVAAGAIVVWALLGPAFHYSDTWQLVVNTATTVVTFLMVFLIQNAQNRDSKAVHLKLDELIRSTTKARNLLVDVEELSDAELRKLEDEFRELHLHYGSALAARRSRSRPAPSDRSRPL